jgi:hypothetical protein
MAYYLTHKAPCPTCHGEPRPQWYCLHCEGSGTLTTEVPLSEALQTLVESLETRLEKLEWRADIRTLSLEHVEQRLRALEHAHDIPVPEARDDSMSTGPGQDVPNNAPGIACIPFTWLDAHKETPNTP